MIEAIKIPEIGENVASGVVVAVHVKPGDTVAVDDTVIELETDKALVEIPSPFSGRIIDVLAKTGAQMKVGDVIARVETETQEASPSSETAETAKEEPQAVWVKPENLASDQPDISAENEDGAEDGAKERSSLAETTLDAPMGTLSRASERPSVPAAPSIRRLARELGVEIHTIQGSGPGGRIIENDIKAAVKRRLTTAVGDDVGAKAPEVDTFPDFSRWGTVDIEPMETVRRLTAQSTATSWSTVPHVTQFDEADITAVVAFIAKNTLKAEQRGAKLTLTAVVSRVCAEALKHFPRFNASVDVAGNRILLKRYIHIGIAADTPRGLLVPVLRHADQQSILELAKAIGDLADRARNKKLKPDEMEGGTFTISNQGSIGGVGFTPIVMWPQVAILGISRASVKPVHVHDRFEPRTILPLSLSYDHRIIDGADAAHFLRWIAAGLEQPLNLFLE